MTSEKTPHSIPKILIIIFIQLIIAAIHAFRLGQVFNGQLYILYYSYFSDFIIPFGGYFLLSINDASIPVSRKWYVKAGIIFFLATTSETLQIVGIEILGVTFDPIDIVMYGAGVLIAAFIDVKIFAPNFGFWAAKEEQDEK